MGTLMRRYWIPALFSHQLAEPDGPPVRVKLLGEELVAFRDTTGQVALIEEHCAHRGASLFFGRNEECGLRCVYHGWKYDVTGQCVDMPSEPIDSDFKRKIRLTTYPCVERGGTIWTYMGPPALRPAFPELEWTGVPEAHRYDSRRLQECNWLQAMEGGIDSAHVPILHHGARLLKQRWASPDPSPYLRPEYDRIFELVPADYGFIVGDRRDLPDGTTRWAVKHWFIPMMKTITAHQDHMPVGAHAWVPIDDHNCMVYSWEYHPDRPISQEERDYYNSGEYIHADTIPGSDRAVLNKDNDYGIDRQAQSSGASFTGIWGIGTQDSAMQESMGPIQDRTREHLGTSDSAIIGIRRCLLRVLQEMAQGAEPPGLDAASYRVRSINFVLPSEVPLKDVAPERVRIPAVEAVPSLAQG
jgi:phenylpropionate dioxygenase-like ring-hydroxylating dioxygenase large terminal subunit